MDETSWRRTGQRYGQHNQPPMTNHIVCVWFFCVSLIIHAAQWITRIKSVERFFFAIEFSLLFFFVLFYFICLLVALDEPNLFENNRDSALKSHYSLTHRLRTDEIMACSTSSFSCRNFFERKSREEPEMRRSPEPTAIFSVGSLHFLTTYIRVCLLNACHPFSKHMPSYSSVARCSSSAVRARQWEWLGVAGCPYIHYIFLPPFVVVDVCAWVNERESIAGQYIHRYTYYYRVC